MTWSIEELSVAIDQLSPVAKLELERNLYRNRAEAKEADDDGVQDEG